MNLLSVQEMAPDVMEFDIGQQIMIGLDYCLGRNNRGKNLLLGRNWLWIAATYNRSLVAEYNWASTWMEQPEYNESDVIYIEDIELIAEQGNAAALYLLGVYHSGSNEDKQVDIDLALKYYEKAVQQQFYPAINNLADKYENGTGVAKNVKIAFEFYSAAADQGIAASQFSLGLFYLKGLYVEKDEELARDWLKKAEKNGWFPASEILLNMLH
jgi:TPR repeat protein